MSTPTSTWFITGCSSGLGRTTAEAALAEGHQVVATARDVRTLAALEANERCLALPLDVTDPASIQASVQQALQRFGRLDVLLNNAGVGLVGAVEECSEEEVRGCFETNFFGPLQVILALLPTMRAQRSGRILHISAAAAIANYPGFSAYGAAKAAMELASESLAQEVAPHGIHVTLVQPGPFRTDFVGRSLHKAAHSLPEYDATSGRFRRLIESMNGKQPGDPAKAARALLALAATEKPPLRLVLGKYANDKAKRRSANLETERQAWESLGLATEF
jgi:NAD(P)-dependent dehydrogenase (short-subunit alcohol dehydrogenase family)